MNADRRWQEGLSPLPSGGVQPRGEDSTYRDTAASRRPPCSTVTPVRLPLPSAEQMAGMGRPRVSDSSACPRFDCLSPPRP